MENRKERRVKQGEVVGSAWGRSVSNKQSPDLTALDGNCYLAHSCIAPWVCRGGWAPWGASPGLAVLTPVPLVAGCPGRPQGHVFCVPHHHSPSLGPDPACCLGGSRVPRARTQARPCLGGMLSFPLCSVCHLVKEGAERRHCQRWGCGGGEVQATVAVLQSSTSVRRV